MKFTVPIRLVSEANTRGHWSGGASRASAARQAVTAAVIDAGGRVVAALIVTAKKQRWVARWKDAPALPLVVTITRVGPRQLDDDNMARAGKAVRDQVAELLEVDDADPRITWAYAQVRSRGAYSCTISLEARA